MYCNELLKRNTSQAQHEASSQTRTLRSKETGAEKMPLTSAIQSAMAVRMEREKRHQRRLSKIRRESGVGVSGGGAGQSIICTKRQSVASVGTLEEEEEHQVRAPPDKSDSWVTTFHMGIVFILLGFIMIVSSMIPTSLIKVSPQW